MESWTTPTDLTDWSENAPGGLVEQETNPAHVYEQLSAARVTRSAAGGLTIQKTGIMLQPGADYVLSFEAKFDQVFTNPMIVRVFNLTAGQDLQSDGSWAASGHTAFFDVSTSYQKISIPFTVDPGFSASDDIRLVIGHRGATPVGSMLWIDDVRITE